MGLSASLPKKVLFLAFPPLFLPYFLSYFLSFLLGGKGMFVPEFFGTLS